MFDTMTHRPTPDLMIGYATGALPEAVNLLMATHITMCDASRAELESLDALGGAVMQDCSAELAQDSFQNVLARLDAKTSPAPEAASSDLPAPLHGYVGRDLTAVKWRRLGMGVKQSILPTSGTAQARLLSIPAGVEVPEHSHRGLELTLVLKGAFHDGTERFGPGDLEIADEHVHHTPRAEDGEDCICLAVTDAPLRFSQFVPRLLQPLFRI